MFGIRKQLSGRVLLLRCDGPLNGQALTPEQVVSTVKARGVRLLVLDTTQASFIDTDGLRWLQRLREKLAETGSSLRIAARPKGKVWRTLRLFNYDKDMYDSPARAWKSEWRLQHA